THGSIEHSIPYERQRRSALEEDNQSDADPSRDLGLLRLHHPHVRQAAQQHRHPGPRLSGWLLHGRTGLADRVRRPAVLIRETAKQDRSRVRRGRRRVREDQLMATQTTTASADAFYKQLGRMYGTYTGGFIGVIVLLPDPGEVGGPKQGLGYLD